MLFTILLTGLVITQRISAGMLLIPTTFNSEETNELKLLSNIVCDLPFSCAIHNTLAEGICECGCEDYCEASDEMIGRLNAHRSSHSTCSDYTHLIKRAYFVHTKCAPGSSQDLIADCKAVETFKDVIWVTDTTSHEHYRNIACAKCNGVSVNDLLPWILHSKSTCKHYTDEGRHTQGGGIISGSRGFNDESPIHDFGGGFNTGGFRGSNGGFGSVSDGPVNGVAGSNGELVDAGQTGINDGVSGGTAGEFGFGSNTGSAGFGSDFIGTDGGFDVGGGFNTGGFSGSNGGFRSVADGPVNGVAGSDGELVDADQTGINDGVSRGTAGEFGFGSNTGSAVFGSDFIGTDGGFDVGGGFGRDLTAAHGFPDLLAALTYFGNNSTIQTNNTLEIILNFLDNYTATGCLETLQPPDAFYPMNEYCLSRNIVSSCNASLNGSIGSFDLLERACEVHEYRTPMAAGVGGVVYMNPYCFLCNTVNPEDIDLFKRSDTNTRGLVRSSTDTITDDGTGSRGSRQGSLDMYIVFIFQSFVMASW